MSASEADSRIALGLVALQPEYISAVLKNVNQQTLGVSQQSEAHQSCWENIWMPGCGLWQSDNILTDFSCANSTFELGSTFLNNIFSAIKYIQKQICFTLLKNIHQYANFNEIGNTVMYSQCVCVNIAHCETQRSAIKKKERLQKKKKRPCLRCFATCLFSIL